MLYPNLPTTGARKRGSALVASLIVVMIVASLGAALIQTHAAIARRQMQSINDKRALYIAEAGLSEAFLAITHGKSGSIGSEEEPALFGNGLFWVEAAEQPDGTIALVSNGLCESGRFSLSLVVQRQVSPLASLGVFGDESVDIGQGALIDGYDSSQGPYDSQLDATLSPPSTGQGARISSNASIQVDGGRGPGFGAGGGDATWIYGDAIPGPNGSVLADHDVLITGSTTPALKPFEVEPLEPPSGLDVLPSLSATEPGNPLVVSNVEAWYRTIRVTPGSELVLRGPVAIRAAGLVMEPGARLTIDTTGGAVMVYVTSFVSLPNGSVLENPTQDPTQVALAIGAHDAEIDFDGDGVLEPSVTLRAAGEFYGLLYAPHSHLSLPGSLRMYGCVNARSVEFMEDSHFSYDAAMMTTGVAVTQLPRLLSWRITALPQADIVRHRVDPIRWLQLQGVTPRPSHEAYKETYVHVEYIDNQGAPQLYDGLEASFDWSQVQSIEAMRWAEDSAGLATAPTSQGNDGGLLSLLD